MNRFRGLQKLAGVVIAVCVIAACKKVSPACTTCPIVAGVYLEQLAQVPAGAAKAPLGETPCVNFTVNSETNSILVQQSGSTLTIHTDLIFQNNGTNPVDSPLTATLDENNTFASNAVQTYYFDGDGTNMATNPATLSLNGTFELGDGGTISAFQGTYVWSANGCAVVAPTNWIPQD